jgi:hypothetical protein
MKRKCELTYSRASKPLLAVLRRARIVTDPNKIAMLRAEAARQKLRPAGVPRGTI